VACRDKNRYSDADAEFLQEVANQVALAVENMRSYEEIATLKARLEKKTFISRRRSAVSITVCLVLRVVYLLVETLLAAGHCA
jgi:GAF domain-containing protein